MVKKIFITGSSRGIGFELAKKLQNDGFDVMINSNNIKNLKKASKLLNNCDYYLGDVTNSKSVKTIINKIKIKKKQIDVLICNYGNSAFALNHMQIENAFKHNFFSTVNVVNEGINILRKNTGKIICISSICGIEVIKNAPIGYSVAKSALNNYVKSISHYLGDFGISINSIALGNIYFNGSIWQKKIKENKKKTLEYINTYVPLKKFGNVDDIFQLCSFIIKNKSQYASGSTFVLDGGQTKKY